jgi:putative DNA primase/helicase
VSDVLKLVHYLCGRRPDATEYLIDWCAHLVQKPHQHTSVAPVLIGEQGTGKNMYSELIMGGILKHLFVLFGSADAILENFNSDQARRFLTVLDEATWAKNEKIVAKLKNLTGSTTIQINGKFAPQYTLKHFSRYIILSNNVDAVRVEPGNRRYLILESNEVLPPEFFEALGARIESGEAVSAWYHYLLQRDVSAFKPRQFPKHIDTEGNDSKVAAMGPVGQFWYELLCAEPMQIWCILNSGNVVLTRKRAADAFNEWARSNGEKQLSGNRFWLHSRKYLGRTSDGRTGDGSRCLTNSPTELRRIFLDRNRLTLIDVDYDDSAYINGLDDMGF